MALEKSFSLAFASYDVKLKSEFFEIVIDEDKQTLTISKFHDGGIWSLCYRNEDQCKIEMQDIWADRETLGGFSVLYMQYSCYCTVLLEQELQIRNLVATQCWISFMFKNLCMEPVRSNFK